MTCRTVALTVSLPLSALAQDGTTSTIPGLVVGTAGDVMPGADVQIAQEATGATQSAVSNEQGASSVPASTSVPCTVTATLQGYKTFIANNLAVRAGAPENLRAVLGGLEEQTVLSSSPEIA